MVMMTLVFVTAKQVVTRERSRGGEQCSGDVIHVHKYEIEYRGFEKNEKFTTQLPSHCRYFNRLEILDPGKCAKLLCATSQTRNCLSEREIVFVVLTNALILSNVLTAISFLIWVKFIREFPCCAKGRRNRKCDRDMKKAFKTNVMFIKCFKTF